jgi:hypothetical protein
MYSATQGLPAPMTRLTVKRFGFGGAARDD